ncbi:class I SAM-dependent methyltransferase [Gilvimarinus xylanilyticus]|uniref:Class I SAM-dependent methyltransferase n=1 Tax=Gilvimarinus xylanilyticus TaxID=2944139 RepID=A0A9X2HVY3_9GAMM|nr:class I SAM-dependent methyltransferase [Gilvimarinus xylanilyticus]MCP8897999.1 class I SAM-dependent methyltransferase [Gilvimarinus xylanilyticus]
MSDLPCPLCQSRHTEFYYQDSKRDYYQCLSCQLVFVPPGFYLSAAQEKAEYDLHENSGEDAGYRRFLSRALSPLLPRLAPGCRGLDFGCGPEPVLQKMLQERGVSVSVYDVFYAPDPESLNARYDFITATEVVEHLHYPQRDLNQLWSCLMPGGWLVIMTKRVLDKNAFTRWHYKNDPTHVCFFSQNTFHWLAQQWGAELILADKDVVLLQKPAF